MKCNKNVKSQRLYRYQFNSPPIQAVNVADDILHQVLFGSRIFLWKLFAKIPFEPVLLTYFESKHSNRVNKSLVNKFHGESLQRWFCQSLLNNVPLRSKTIGRPARIFVTSNEIKYPTMVGKDLPKIDITFDGWSSISAREFHKDPAVTEM